MNRFDHKPRPQERCGAQLNSSQSIGYDELKVQYCGLGPEFGNYILKTFPRCWVELDVIFVKKVSQLG